MMKFSNLLFLTLAICICLPFFASAKMQVNFPNANPLQPIPNNVAPNISHNVNSADNGNRPAPSSPNATDQNENTQLTKTSQPATATGFANYLWLAIAIIAILACSFIIYRWLQP